jgi:hypothetical protein
MKLILVVFSILVLGFSALAANDVKKTKPTEASWFSPDCPDCARYLTPGQASIGNDRGVYRRGSNQQSRKKSPNPNNPQAPAAQ